MKRIESNLANIMQERKNRFKRFFSAKRHRNELQDVVNQLEMARSNYTVSRLDTPSHVAFMNDASRRPSPP